jgi:PAS domain S-box-containing protein
MAKAKPPKTRSSGGIQAGDLTLDWEATFNASQDAIWILDRDHNILRSNRAAERMFGLTLEEMAGLHCCAVVHRTDRPHPDCPFAMATVSARRETMEINDGGTWLRIVVDPICDEAGSVIGAVHVVSDISESKRGEELIRESERRLATLMGNLPGMAYRCNNDLDWTMQFVSAGCKALTGYSSTELVGEKNPSFGELILPAFREQVWNEVQAAVERQQPFELTYQLLTKDGRKRWVWERGCGVFSPQGELIALEGFISDIDEQRRAEHDREQSERRFRRLLERAPLPLCYVNAVGTIIFRNERFVEMIGYDEEQVPSLAEWWPKAYPDQDYRSWALATWNEAVARAKREERDIESIEYRVTCADGVERVMEISGIVLGRNFLAMFIDNTDRVRADQERLALIEQLEQRNEELERFSYSVSHDLRTPLVTIGGFSGQLRRDLEAGNQENMAIDLDFIESSARQMNRLLSDLLHLARSGKAVGEAEVIDLHRLIADMLEYCRGVLAGCEVHLASASEPLEVFADRERLREVFQNLLENAAKFCSFRNPGLIEVGCRREGEQVLCWVADNGIGIPQQHHERVFGLFERLDQEREGTGIGLAIVRRIIEKHAGEVWVESDGDDCGATFFFTLPSSPATL